MIVRWVTGFLDTPSRDAEPFWLAVTGTSLSARRGPDGRFATLVPAAGDAFLRVQVVGDPPARAHLDLHVDDVAAAARVVTGLGAALTHSEEDLAVLRSPAGIVFCLVPWHGERELPRAVRWEGPQSSLVDQLALDIPAPAYPREVMFWAAVTGWERKASDLPEFSFLQASARMPLRLLLQRVGSASAGVHLDLACDDVDAEVRRHLGLGATVVRRVPGDWTTLRDPAGREYCVTARSPF
ncbi:VOC family protein [Actinoplanes sp. NPDC051861]|uniref:VOC family protein n=1 Tax=Actinoplanes sp. NPDC051861 TaxID=3155170 RepID=UPI00343D6DB7